MRDSNLRLLRPERSALTRLRYTRIMQLISALYREVRHSCQRIAVGGGGKLFRALFALSAFCFASRGVLDRVG